MWLKISGIILLCFVLDGIGHALLPASPYMKAMSPSLLSATIGIMPVAMLYMLMLFIVIAITIHSIIKHSVDPLKTGIQAGLSLSGLWFIAFFEPWAILGTSLVSEFIMGLNDSVPVALMGLLLGIVSKKRAQGDIQKLKNPLKVLILPICYIIGRYVLYLFVKIVSGQQVRPLETLIWTVAMGLWIGYMYYSFMAQCQKATIPQRVLYFGIQIFGVNWILFNLFMPAVFAMNTIDFIIRSVGDTFFVLIGVIIIENT